MRWSIVKHKGDRVASGPIGLSQRSISYSCPEGRHCHAMWAAKGKVYVFGGWVWTGRSVPPMDYDKRLEEEDGLDERGLLYSSRRTWPHQQYAKPSIRAAHHTILRGEVHHTRPSFSASLHAQMLYLGDTFLYDTQSKRWKIISTDSFPDHRSGHALAYVAPSGGPPSDHKGKLMGGGRALLFGGYKGGATTESMPLNEVWELTLRSSLKLVSATCHCCGKFFGPGGGLRKSTGTCEGAVVLCSEECSCRRKHCRELPSWEDHKLRCRRKKAETEGTTQEECSFLPHEGI